MPTSCSRLSFANSVRSGASSWHGTHHEAQTLTTLTLPLNTAGSSPGTGASLLTRPCSGGSAVAGAGRPIRTEGIFEGSPPLSRNRKMPASAMKPISGSAINQELIHERLRGDASVVMSEVLPEILPEILGSLIGYPPRRARTPGDAAS